jgi:uncharacterized membrane protein
MNTSIRIPAFRQFLAMPGALFLPVLPIIMFCTIALVNPVAGHRVPEQIPYWTLFFGLPHIVASFQTSCDAEYLSAYRLHVLRVLGIFMLPFALYQIGMPGSWILLAFSLLTVYHVIAQQYGIAFAAARLRPSALTSACKWSTVALGIIAYMQAYLGPEPAGGSLLAELFAAPLLAVILVTGGTLVWRARSQRAGAALLALNLFLFVLAIVLVFSTPFVLAGLMLVRILHDATGFVAYIRHDTQRNREQRKNILYRAFPFLPIWFLNPVLAIAIAAALTRLAQDLSFVAWLVIGISLAHYYIESFIWKRGTPHRQHFSMS